MTFLFCLFDVLHIIGHLFILLIQKYRYSSLTSLNIEAIVAVLGLLFCCLEFAFGFGFAFTFNNNEKSV